MSESTKTNLIYSMPKQDRGLLSIKKNKINASPADYNNLGKAIQKNNGAFSMPRSSRDYHFAKYGSQHSTLVEKGLF